MLQLDSLSGVSSSDGDVASNNSGTLQVNSLLDGSAPSNLDARNVNSGFTSLINWRADYQVSHGGVEGRVTPGDKKETSDDEDYRPFTPPPPRERLSYTRYQLALLNGIYQEVRYPNGYQKQLIAKRVGITREQVKIWFQNRRRKDVVTKNAPTTSGKSEVKGNTSDTKACSTDVSIAISVGDNSSEGCNRLEDQNGCIDNGDRFENRTHRSPDNKGNCYQQSSASSVSQIVPPVLLRSIILELNKFNNEQLKLKKSKKKRKKSRGSKAAPPTATPAKLSSLPSFTSLSSCQAPRLFQSYDMIAPPNKLTPTANTTLHASETSAFRNPRSQNIASRPWEHLNLSTTSVPSQYNSTGFMQSYSAPENLPTASDMPKTSSVVNSLSPLKLRPAMPLEARFTSAVRSLEHPGSERVQIHPLTTSSTVHTNAHLSHLLQRHDTGFSGTQSNKTCQPHSMAHPPFSLRSQHSSQFAAYPFPLVAEPPMMLSHARQPEPYLQPPSWPTLSSTTHLSSQQTPPGSFLRQDSFRPLLITSLNNPYFSQTQLAYSSPRSTTSSPMSWSPRSSDPNNNHFTQL